MKCASDSESTAVQVINSDDNKEQYFHYIVIENPLLLIVLFPHLPHSLDSTLSDSCPFTNLKTCPSVMKLSFGSGTTNAMNTCLSVYMQG